MKIEFTRTQGATTLETWVDNHIQELNEAFAYGEMDEDLYEESMFAVNMAMDARAEIPEAVAHLSDEELADEIYYMY